MTLFETFLNEYGTTLLYTVITAIAGYLGIFIKRLYEQYVNDKTKQDVAKTVVKAVEQIYKDIHGKEKLDKALDAAAEILQSKNITVTDLELELLIESAIAEFNDAFNKNDTNATNKKD